MVLSDFCSIFEFTASNGKGDDFCTTYHKPPETPDGKHDKQALSEAIASPFLEGRDHKPPETPNG
jgi:hypothetical protein